VRLAESRVRGGKRGKPREQHEEEDDMTFSERMAKMVWGLVPATILPALP
jgi:hypothetical protein